MQGDDVGFGKELVERDVLNSDLEAVWILDAIVGEDVAAEAVEDAGDAVADLARAEDADGAAPHVKADQAVEREVAFANAVVGAMELAIEGEHKANRVFGDGVGRVGRYTNDADAEFVGGLEDDVVEAGAAESDQARAAFMERAKDLCIERVLDEGADDGEAGCQRSRLVCEPGGDVCDLELMICICRVEEGSVVRLGAENGDFCGGQRDLPEENAFCAEFFE